SMVSRSAVEPRALGRALLLGLAVAACSTDHAAPSGSAPVDGGFREDGTTSTSSGVTPAPEGAPYETLEDWHLFADAKAQTPEAGVVTYEVIAQLFADYAYKRRFLFVPKGKKIGYSETDRWTFPVGTILVKPFSYLT